MVKLTEYSIKYLGFELVKEYEHDHFFTNRYKKGALEVEFTYDESKLITTDLTIKETNCLPIDTEELKQLDKILNKELI